jgi:tripartite-type tricarboxylate transporter receptor subunit TctC
MFIVPEHSGSNKKRRATPVAAGRTTPMNRIVTTLAAALGVGLCAMTLSASPSLAQTWPQKPVRFIVPFPPGGGTDFVARLVAKNLQDKLGQTIVVENRGGANGAIGLMTVKQSLADGYTFAFTSDTPMTVNPWLYKDLSYQALKDFIPVASAVRLPGMLAAHPSFPANNIAELIALAKEKPGSINYASAGVGNFSHLAMELFAGATGTKLQHVPYKGTGPAAQALLSGEVQVGFNNVQTLLQFVQEGKLKALGVAEPKRMPQFPDFPAVAETVPGFEMAPWVGIVAPVGTPQAIVDRLSEATVEVMSNPAIAKQFSDQQLTVMTLAKEKFGDLIKSDLAKWEKVVKDANIKPE